MIRIEARSAAEACMTNSTDRNAKEAGITMKGALEKSFDCKRLGDSKGNGRTKVSELDSADITTTQGTVLHLAQLYSLFQRQGSMLWHLAYLQHRPQIWRSAAFQWSPGQGSKWASSNSAHAVLPRRGDGSHRSCDHSTAWMELLLAKNLKWSYHDQGVWF